MCISRDKSCGDSERDKIIKRLVKVVERVLGIPVNTVTYRLGAVAFRFHFVFNLAVLVVEAVYIVVRVYSELESFMNLSYLRESAYKVLTWLLYVPHIG